MQYPEPIARLIDSYMKLPGIGEKSATRLAFYTLGMSDADVDNFAKSLRAVKRDLHYCSVCGNITEDDPCPICKDKTRDQSRVLVVERSRDINLESLLKRLEAHKEIQEVIVATNASLDGETTAQYLAHLIKPAGIKVTRLAHGLSAGADIDYTDEVTLFRAVQGRTEM